MANIGCPFKKNRGKCVPPGESSGPKCSFTQQDYKRLCAVYPTHKAKRTGKHISLKEIIAEQERRGLLQVRKAKKWWRKLLGLDEAPAQQGKRTKDSKKAAPTKRTNRSKKPTPTKKVRHKGKKKCASTTKKTKVQKTTRDREELIELLNDWDIDVHGPAQLALEKIGKPAIELLMQPFHETTEPVQERIAKVFERIGKPAVEPLCEVLLDYYPNSDRGNAIVAETLGNIGDTRAVEPLIDALCQSEDEFEEEVIEEALVKIGKPAVEPLIKALQQEDELYCRWGLAKVLGDIGDGRAVEPLTELLEDEDDDEDVREAVKKALEEIKSKKATKREM